ncbi:MAG: serine--tRNA ligase [Bacteroidales bacterium]|jgi:seryl-tRNA synthetase|nr:serine--tRNA ligase [Bacteroidales bacterium]MDD4703768.1 serine--tRNA ligase [Bacteroidales bacterium]
MLEINKIRLNKENVIELLGVKNFKDADQKINTLIDLDEKKRQVQKQLEDIKADLNVKAKEIGKFMMQGEKDLAEKTKQEVAALKENSKDLEKELSEKEKEIEELLLSIPNLPHSSVPKGKTAEDNIVELMEGEIPKLWEGATPHWDLCAKYDIVDFELGNKITGSGFPVYKGKGAKLQRALINFFLDEATKNGFDEVQPPLMVNEASAMATGQLPDKEGQMYAIPLDGFYMIPTAEVPLTNIYRDTILQEKDFPIKKCGYSQCFRREAGSYGKDVRGLNRLHQFDKVEIVCIAHPDKSYEQLEKMKQHVMGILSKLELPYRILRLCGGDMSFTSALTFDFETYSAAQERWLEVSSVSNFETFQSNRLKLRFKNQEGKTQLAHTLNGSALALPRIVASLLENNQTPQGIRIPKALVPYTGFEIID